MIDAATIQRNVQRSIETRRQYLELCWQNTKALATERSSLRKRLAQVARELEVAEDCYFAAVDRHAEHVALLIKAGLLPVEDRWTLGVFPKRKLKRPKEEEA